MHTNEKSTCASQDVSQNPLVKSAKAVPQNETFNNLIKGLADTLGVQYEVLDLWLNEYFQDKPVGVLTKLSFLYMAVKYQLDPITHEIGLWQDATKKSQWHAFITVDGWMRLIQRHPHFCGITTSESKDEMIQVSETIKVPNWMECSIYRNDRVLPTTVREYFEELKNEGDTWQNIPRRMLRHRVISQCARLAFGVATGDSASGEVKPKENGLTETNGTNILDTTLGSSTSRTLYLKERLSATKKILCTSSDLI